MLLCQHQRGVLHLISQKEEDAVVVGSCWKNLHSIDNWEVQEKNLNVFSCWVGFQQMIVWGFVHDCISAFDFPHFNGSVFTRRQDNIVTEMNNLSHMGLMGFTNLNDNACENVINENFMKRSFRVFSGKVNEILFLSVIVIIQFRFGELPGLHLCELWCFLVVG